MKTQSVIEEIENRIEELENAIKKGTGLLKTVFRIKIAELKWVLTLLKK